MVDYIGVSDLQRLLGDIGPGTFIQRLALQIEDDYRRWGEGQVRAGLSVGLLYASAYGNTAAIADALARGVARSGVRVESLNCEFAEPELLRQTIRGCDALLIGSPTLGGHAPTPIVSALGTVLAEGDRRKPVGVFGSFGWSGEAIELLETKLRDGGFTFAFDPIRVRFSPDAATLRTLLAERDELRAEVERLRQENAAYNDEREIMV